MHPRSPAMTGEAVLPHHHLLPPTQISDARGVSISADGTTPRHFDRVAGTGAASQAPRYCCCEGPGLMARVAAFSRRAP